MKSGLLFFFVNVLFWVHAVNLSAQKDGCGTVVTPEVIELEAQFRKTLREEVPFGYTPVTLSLTAHLLHEDDGSDGLTEMQVTQALEKLNQDFAPVGIRFVWCIKHLNSSRLYHFEGPDSDDEDILRAEHNVLNSMNIYFLDVPSLCGYAYFPTPSLSRNQQQLVIMNVSCAMNGSTLSHEVGHFFLLYHTHERAFGTERVDGTNCTDAGDLVCDTPADPQLSYFNVSLDCRYIGTQTDPKGMPYNPQITNFMSYSVKECRNVFTALQYRRMRNAYENYRTYLKSGNATGNSSETDTLTVCAEQITRLTAPKGLSYRWSTGETTPFIQVSPQNTETYSVISEQADGCPITKSWVLIIKNISLTQEKTVICPNGSTALTASGGTDYSWQPSAGLDRTVGAAVKASPARTTTYTLRAKIGNCSVSKTVTVQVELPEITLSRKGVTICDGNGAEVRASGTTRYEWQPQASVKLSSNGAVAILSPDTTTTYTVTGFRDECSNTATVTVSVKGVKLTVTPTDTLVCYGERITLRASGGKSYRWSPAGELTNPTDSVITVTAYRNMEYTVTDNDPACTAVRSVKVRIYEPMSGTLNRKPVSDLNASDGEITLQVKGGTPPYQYALNGEAFQSDSVFRGLKVGLQRVVVRDGNGCESTYYVFLNALGGKNCDKADFEWAKNTDDINIINITEGNSVTTDAQGNVYVTGNFRGKADFGGHVLESALDNQDIFLAKYNAAGTCIWAKGAGGYLNDFGKSVTTDAQGNVYVTGSFWDRVNFGDHRLVSKRHNDIFLAKYDAAGTCIWAKRAGGNFHDNGNSVITDAQENVYITGYFQDTADFGDYSLTAKGEKEDIFFAKYDASGNCIWAKRAGSNYNDSGNSIITDAPGNVYVTGYFDGTADFGDYTLVNKGKRDIFLAKYDAVGTCIWAKKAGGNFDSYSTSVTTDAQGNVYITGDFKGTTDFGGHTLVSRGKSDIFLAKYDAFAGTCLWAKRAGSTEDEFRMGNGLTTDVQGNVYVTGAFLVTADFGNNNLVSKGRSDIFIVKYDVVGTCLWAKRAGGHGDDSGYGVTTDAEGNVYVTGFFTQTADFGKDSLTSKEGYDIFLTKLSCSADTVAQTCAFTATAGNDSSILCNGIGVRLEGSVSGPGINHEWFPADGLDNPKSLTPMATPRQTTTYTLIARKDTCTATAQVTVNVPGTAEFNVENTLLTACEGQIPQTRILNPENLSFSFTVDSGLVFIPPNIIKLQSRRPGTYNITASRPGYCPYTLTVTAKFNPLPVLDVQADAPNRKITAVPVGGTPPYTFSFNGGRFESRSVFENLTPGTHIVAVRDANGCENRDTVTLYNCALFTASAGRDTALCIGQSTILSVEVSLSDKSNRYNWLPVLGLSSSDVLNPVATPLQTTVYTLTVNSIQGCTAVDSVKITVNTLPQVNAGKDTAICPGSSAQLRGTASSSGTYSWMPAESLDDPSAQNPVARPDRTTVYTLTVTNESCTDFDEVVVNVTKLNLNSDEYICKGASVTLNSSGRGYDTYDWKPASGLNNAKIQTPTAAPDRTVTYTLTAVKAGCTFTDSITVNVMRAAAVEDLQICSGSRVQLWAKGGITYKWRPETGLNDPNSPYPVASPLITTVYTAEVTDEYLCTDTVQVRVEVINAGSLPTAVIDSVTEAGCAGCVDGELYVSGSGGLAPYTYSLNGSGYVSEGIFKGLNAGRHLLSVRDANGCTADTMVQIKMIIIVCEAPLNVAVTGTRVSWRSVPTAEQYRTDYRLEGELIWKSVYSADTFNDLSDLLPGKRYEVSVTSICPGAFLSSPSDTVTFQVLKCMLNARISIDKVTCVGKRDGSLRADNLSGGREPYRFSLNGGAFQSENTFTGLNFGSYQLEIRDANGCSVSYTLSVTVAAPDNPPTITLRNDTLFCLPAAFRSYQWFRDGTAVSGNLIAPFFYTDRKSGSYVVRTETADSCIYRSEPYNYFYNSIFMPGTSVSVYEISVYPNPLNDRTTVHFTLSEAQKITLSVYDLQGKLIYTMPERLLSAGEHRSELDLQSVSSGVYLLNIKAGNQPLHLKLIKL